MSIILQSVSGPMNSKFKRGAKRVVKKLAQHTVGKLPPSRDRLTGRLAINRGRPVRDIRLRPWPSTNDISFARWARRVGPALRSVFLSGFEGQPRTRAKEFAQLFANYSNCRYGLLVGHGTDALRIALAAALDHDGLDYGGEVIVPNFSFIASATCALDRGFGIALVDVDQGTLCIDPARVEEAVIPGKTRAIMAVHLFGQPAEMTALQAIARRHNLKLIEDAAQAHGAICESGPVGSLGDAAGFSFQSSKNLNCGEGGLFVTNNTEIFDRAYELHDVGRSRLHPSRWAHHSLGWNMRLNEYAAALLIDRMRNFEVEQQNRATRFASLLARLRDVACVEPLSIHPNVKRHGAHMFVMRYFPELCDNLRIDDFIEVLQREGIPVFRGYEGTLSHQPVFEKIAENHPHLIRVLPTPVADAAVRNTLYIPQEVFRGTEADIAEIAAAFRKVQRHYTPQAIQSSRKTASVTAPLTETRASNMHCTRRLRVGIIGFGAMGRIHAEVICGHPLVQLSAATDARSEAQKAVEESGAVWYDTPEDLTESGSVDVALIATPHWDHSRLSAIALRAGLHVICEKPLALNVREADEILALARGSRGLFAVVFQSRFEPVYRKAKSLLSSGEFGAVLRASLFEASWRSQSYYDRSTWRGTWKGEGGGVLVNQAPHSLDRYAWLFGMPESISARCDTLLHRIETEDSVTAVLRHANGAHGTYHVSTNENPAASKLEVMCERGRIKINQGDMTITRFKESLSQKTLEDSDFFGAVASETREIPGELSTSLSQMLDHFYENFAKAIFGEAPLLCSATEALQAVELANAMLFSSSEGREVKLPLDRLAYEAFFKAKLAGSG